MESKFTVMTDESMAKVAGGYFQVSAWREFVSTQVTPVLNGLCSTASNNDRAIINQVMSILQGTMIPNAEIAGPVQNLWINYNNSFRPRLEGDNVKVAMDQALYSAKRYIEQHS